MPMDGRYAAGAGRTGAAIPWTDGQDFCFRQILSTCIHAGNAVGEWMRRSADIELH